MFIFKNCIKRKDCAQFVFIIFWKIHTFCAFVAAASETETLYNQFKSKFSINGKN